MGCQTSKAVDEPKKLGAQIPPAQGQEKTLLAANSTRQHDKATAGQPTATREQSTAGSSNDTRDKTTVASANDPHSVNEQLAHIKSQETLSELQGLLAARELGVRTIPIEKLWGLHAMAQTVQPPAKQMASILAEVEARIRSLVLQENSRNDSQESSIEDARDTSLGLKCMQTPQTIATPRDVSALVVPSEAAPHTAKLTDASSFGFSVLSMCRAQPLGGSKACWSPLAACFNQDGHDNMDTAGQPRSHY